MENHYTHVQMASDYIRQRLQAFKPTIGIILGTGLGNLIRDIDMIYEISYNEIPHFPVSTVESHKGRFVAGFLSGKPVLVMQGRFHYYEGYSMKQVTLPVRVMKMLGIETLVVSNASGSVNPTLEIGDLLLINDHINLHLENPLTGKNLDEMGPRFPDMSEPYSARLLQKAEAIAQKHAIRYQCGVYASLSGPNLETKAEYRMMHIIGADAVGMSTIPEVLVAVHCNMEVMAISVITDKGYPAEDVKKVSVEDVIAVAGEAEPKMTLIIKEVLEQL
ncbi:MAG: purine-nucleoside phosphorylase [Chitinophagales bacterium]|nr:purine-nucleoside phosphorylase [Bacteroidota bacterium]MCB9042383.1 purine-nucleoside phosphorylase [Chitinophagales bacterium]